MSTVPKDRAYSGTPLPKKLGLVSAKGGIGEVALFGEPTGFRHLLGELPTDVILASHLKSSIKLALCFIHKRAELMTLLDILRVQLPLAAHVWIIHPKAHRKPDLNQNDVRDAVLDMGLVDYKVCSVDADWSGLKFAWRGQSKSAGHNAGHRMK